MLYDLSPRISPRLAVWPGDTPPQRELLLDRARGDPITLSTLRATVHLGSHADAPSHYGSGPSIEAVPLERYLGPCQLIRVAALRGQAIGPLKWPLVAPRVLIATGTAADPFDFHTDFASLSVELVEQLANAGVFLIGVDTPSVDCSDSKELPVHQACLRYDISILEGLRLESVPEGEYELIALPLPLEGFDASPVRAVLRPIQALRLP
ncbi:MAG: cyclase family protein [Gemmataceae bacterium]